MYSQGRQVRDSTAADCRHYGLRRCSGNTAKTSHRVLSKDIQILNDLIMAISSNPDQKLETKKLPVVGNCSSDIGEVVVEVANSTLHMVQ